MTRQSQTQAITPSPAIPDGFWQDARGCLVPASLIKPIDQARDALVRDIVSQAVIRSADLKKFKADVFGDIAAFIDLSAEQYGAELGGKKGNVTFFTFDGRYKVSRAIADNIAFDERLQAARALIDECMAEWTNGVRPEIHAIINQAFNTDKEGQVSVGRVLQLRRLEITDSRWQAAMEAIGESLQVVGSKSYLRVYERIGDTEQYKAIPLDIAGV